MERQAELEAVAAVIAERVRDSMRTRLELAQEVSGAAGTLEADYRQLRRTVVLVQRAELKRLHATGAVSETVRRRLQRQLDLEDTRYTEET